MIVASSLGQTNLVTLIDKSVWAIVRKTSWVTHLCDSFGWYPWAGVGPEGSGELCLGASQWGFGHIDSRWCHGPGVVKNIPFYLKWGEPPRWPSVSRLYVGDTGTESPPFLCGGDIRRYLVTVLSLAIGAYTSLCFSSHLQSSFVILFYYRIIVTHSLKLYWGKNKNKFVFSGQA